MLSEKAGTLETQSRMSGRKVVVGRQENKSDPIIVPIEFSFRRDTKFRVFRVDNRWPATVKTIALYTLEYSRVGPIITAIKTRREFRAQRRGGGADGGHPPRLITVARTYCFLR